MKSNPEMGMGFASDRSSRLQASIASGAAGWR